MYNKQSDIYGNEKKIQEYESIVTNKMHILKESTLRTFDAYCQNNRGYETQIYQKELNFLYNELATKHELLINKERKENVIIESYSLPNDEHKIQHVQNGDEKESQVFTTTLPNLNIPKTPPDLMKYNEKYKRGIINSSSIRHLPPMEEMSGDLRKSMLQWYDMEKRSELKNKSRMVQHTIEECDNTKPVISTLDGIIAFSQSTSNSVGQRDGVQKELDNTQYKDLTCDNIPDIYKHNDSIFCTTKKVNRLSNGHQYDTNLITKEPVVRLNDISSILTDPNYSAFRDSKVHLNFLSSGSLLKPQVSLHPIKRKSNIKKAILACPFKKISDARSADNKTVINTQPRSPDILKKTELSASEIFGDVIVSPGLGISVQKYRESMGLHTKNRI